MIRPLTFLVTQRTKTLVQTTIAWDLPRSLEKGFSQSATTAVDFPQLEIVNIDSLQSPNIDGSVLAEEVGITALPANGRATLRAE